MEEIMSRGLKPTCLRLRNVWAEANPYLKDKFPNAREGTGHTRQYEAVERGETIPY